MIVHHIGDGKQFLAAHGNQAGIARPRSYEIDCSWVHAEISMSAIHGLSNVE